METEADYSMYMEIQRTKNNQYFLGKKKVLELTLSDFKTHQKHSGSKSVMSMQEHTDQENRIKNE